MQTNRLFLFILAIAVAGVLAGCSVTSSKSADVSANITKSLVDTGFKDVSVSQDREKGIVTLAGHVATDADKARAESIAKAMAGAQVVANQIAVIPLGGEKDAKAVNSALDKGIENNLDAALITAKLEKNVRFTVKNHMVTLTGNVQSQDERTRAGEVAAAVLNVEQVVNEVQVRKQKATSSR